MQSALKTRIARVLEHFSEVEAAFLFGSHAVGRARPESDVDIALVPATEALRARKLDLLTAFAQAGLENVDLAILDDSDIVLRFEAVSPNQLVYAKEEFDRGSYYSRVVREYFDFLPILEVQRKAYKERLQRGQA